MPSHDPAPKTKNDSGKLMARVSVIQRPTPRPMYRVASVATNGISRKRVTSMELTTPPARPLASITPADRPSGHPASAKCPARPAPMNIKAPTERSTPPVRSTNVMPTATTTVGAAWPTICAAFSRVRNRSDWSPTARMSTTNSAIGAACSIRSTSRLPGCRESSVLTLPYRRWQRGPQQALAVKLGRLEASADFALAHDDDPITDPHQLVEVRRDHQQPRPIVSEPM